MLEKLQEIIRRYLDDEETVLRNEMVLQTDLGLNSYELVQLICDVEDAFSVEITDRAIRKLKTVQNVIDYIAAYE